jgi:hypothetical protein
MRKGLALALIHIAIVASLGGKLLYDRHTQPRLWVETVSYDPDLPIRGRYVRLQIVVAANAELRKNKNSSSLPAHLRVEDGRLAAEAAPSAQSHISYISFRERGKERIALLNEPVAFFLPGNAPDPSRRPAGETLWAEVTIPKKGPPRPIRLGVKKGDGQIEPFSFQE